jgi:hypothetical protein
MGELMGLALLCTMAAAVLFQPALMGPPRAVAAAAPPHPAREVAEAEAWQVERRQAPGSAQRTEAAAAERREAATASDDIER